ncbi:unnamed protein product [Clavelina lepadiformis]|uniref:Uncharacterized protein n=1 Tax=Clavelina lepadiformis TaxID=159417 RepID=A0ABP0FMV5_CLALP
MSNAHVERFTIKVFGAMHFIISVTLLKEIAVPVETIGRMKNLYNNLQSSNTDDVIGLLRVVKYELWIHYCFIGHDGGKRDVNQDERERIQESLGDVQT